MGTTTTGSRAGYLGDVRRVWDLIEITPGLPVPFISPDRAAFYFTNIVHPEDARQAVADAETVLSYAFGDVPFTHDRIEQAGSTRRYVYEALLPSGLVLALTVKAEHVEGSPASREHQLAGAA